MTITPTLNRGQTGSGSINEVLDAALTLQSYTVATVPDEAENAGKLIHVSNGAAGSPCLAYSNGTGWLRVLLGAVVAVV